MKSDTMTKSRIEIIFAVLLLVAVFAPMIAFGVSYPPAQLYHQKERDDKFVKGSIVYMFHSGTDDVKKTIHVNDTLNVYRVDQACEMAPVGIVKVVSFVGDTHIKGEVFAGEIYPDDIAKKDNVSCLIISAETCKR